MASKKSYLNFVTEINGKPVDASSHIFLYIDINNTEELLHIEKVFGIVSREKNVLLKFKLTAQEYKPDESEDNGYRLIGWKLIYLSEDLIDCKFGTSARKEDWKTKENLSLGDEILNFKDYSYCFSLEIDICFKTTNEKLTGSISRSFNDKTTSDFIVKCHDKEFHVHQYILKQQSKYFDRLLNNNFVESENKSVTIDDFEPEIVEILLRYLYTGAVCLQEKMGIMTSLLKIVDKYNFIEVLDTIDSFCAQKTNFWRLNLDTKSNEEKTSIFEEHVTLVEESKLPKLAAMLFLWKNSDKIEISDEIWSKLIRENPTFSMLVANTGGRKDYQSWVGQHTTWCFYVKDYVKKKDEMVASTLIVGTLGEMKGAVKCSAIL